MPTNKVYEWGDFVRFALESELVKEPGAEAAFNDSAKNLLAGVIAGATGQRLERLLVAEIFAPLGIADFYDDGRVVGGRADGYLGQYLVIYPRKVSSEFE